MIHRLISTLLVIAWGLWFGSIVMVFVTVTSLFTTFADQRGVAGAAAAGVFRRFEVLELVAAAVAVVCSLTLRARARPGRAATLLAGLLVLATVGALASKFMITPRIDELRRQGVSSMSDEFKKLHGTSSIVYSSQAVLLLAAGLVLPSALARTRAEPA